MLTVNGYLNSFFISKKTHGSYSFEIPTCVIFTIIRADWLKNADVMEVVSQLGLADAIFSAGETHKSRQRRLLSQARSFTKNKND